MTVSLKNKCVASPQRKPHLCRAAPAAPWGRTVAKGSTGQISRERERHWGREPLPLRKQQGRPHLAGELLPPRQPTEPKTSCGEKHFSPLQHWEISLNVFNSKRHFWSSQLLGGKQLHLWLTYSQSPTTPRNSEVQASILSVKTPLNKILTHLQNRQLLFLVVF